MLNLLHDTHIGVVRMKSLARSRVWWPGIDADIERLSSQCVTSAQNSKNPAKSVWDSFILIYQCGTFPQVRNNVYASTTLGRSMDLCGLCGFIFTVTTVGRNKSRVRADSTQCANFEKSSLCWVTFTKVSDNGTPVTSRELGEFCIKHGIRHILQHLIIRQRMEKLNASSKCSNVLFVRQVHQILIKPRQSNSTKNARFIGFFNAIGQYLTLRPDAHHLNYVLVVQFELHWIFPDLKYNGKF